MIKITYTCIQWCVRRNVKVQDWVSHEMKPRLYSTLSAHIARKRIIHDRQGDNEEWAGGWSLEIINKIEDVDDSRSTIKINHMLSFLTDFAQCNDLSQRFTITFCNTFWYWSSNSISATFLRELKLLILLNSPPTAYYVVGSFDLFSSSLGSLGSV